MLIIPAIDIRDGKCVRLVKGRLEEETVYSDNPAQMAQMWQSKGAPMLHLVDLDGAFAGEPKNLPVIRQIRESVSVPIQLGGGMRTLEIMEKAFDLGMDRLVLGTAAAADPEFLMEAVKKFQDKIAVGIDNKEGKVAVEGWKRHSSQGVLEFARSLERLGVTRLVYTDTSRDGTLVGPNLDGIAAFLEATPSMKVIISGGIAVISDIEALTEMSLSYPNIEGVIIGKSLYSKTIELEEALKVGRC